MDRCDECAFVYDDVPLDQIADRVASFGTRYGERLTTRAPERLRRRPAPDVWSGLEYSCHVRDAFSVLRARLAKGLAEDRPEFVSMGRDQLVIERRYNEQDPVQVADELARQADMTASAFRALTPSQWERIGIYHWPERSEHTMVWLGRHAIHEGEHHLLDIDRGLGPAGSDVETGQ